MKNPSFHEIQAAYERKAYKFYTQGSFNINLFGIRSDDSQSNKFDDIVGVAFYIDFSTPAVFGFKATTDPGKYWLQNPMSREGTAILVPGQYKGSHAIGVHGRSGKSPYKALEQINHMTYVRDNNKDMKLDFELYRDPELLKKHGFSANIKSNIHRASLNVLVQFVEKYSAACQVIQSADDFAKLIVMCEESIKKGFSNKFSYTLFEESEVWA